MQSLRVLGALVVIATSVLSGCGTTSGALVGGAAGHAIGHDTKSTVGGAVVGGVIGHEMNK